MHGRWASLCAKPNDNVLATRGVFNSKAGSYSNYVPVLARTVFRSPLTVFPQCSCEGRGRASVRFLRGSGVIVPPDIGPDEIQSGAGAQCFCVRVYLPGRFCREKAALRRLSLIEWRLLLLSNPHKRT